MLSLDIGATGMLAQQMHVDVISNNIANMTTTGYKRQRPEFQDLMYQNKIRPGATSSDVGTVIPSGIQLGLGVKPGSVYRIMEQGSMQITQNDYDLAINGVEVGGGSIRIHDKKLQQKMFDLLGFTKDEAKAQFGFLMNAFEYGAPPHGGIAFGFDRLCAILTGTESIRDVIAFPKNNMGRDIMIDAPSPISNEQRDELSL